MTSELRDRAARLLRAFGARNWKLATAESCTGGLLAGLLTEIPGSSTVVERGFVTYSNAAKVEMLNVPEDLITAHGAVSEEVARAMADGALAHSRAGLAMSITGIAGPGGGTAVKPVGLVHFALAHRGQETQVLVRRYGDLGRQAIRMRAVEDALWLLERAVAA